MCCDPLRKRARGCHLRAERAKWAAELREKEREWERELDRARGESEKAAESIRRELEGATAKDAHLMLEKIERMQKERDTALR